MRRGIDLLMLGAVMLVHAHLAEAQQAKRVPRIGFLLSRSVSANPNVEAFRQGLRDLGYFGGRNSAIEYREAEEKYARLPDLSAELVRLKVDVILAQAPPAARAAKQATKTIPIVFVNVPNPVGSGLVASLAHPGGNITGLTNVSADLSGKHIELLKDALPKVTYVAVLWNPANPGNALVLKETQAAAQPLGVQFQLQEVQDPKNIDSAFSAMTIRARWRRPCVGGPDVF